MLHVLGTLINWGAVAASQDQADREMGVGSGNPYDEQPRRRSMSRSARRRQRRREKKENKFMAGVVFCLLLLLVVLVCFLPEWPPR